MNIQNIVTSVGTLVLGVFGLAIVVSLLLGYFFGSSMRKPTTIVVESPDSYKRWWGHYGAGLPGWGSVGPTHPTTGRDSGRDGRDRRGGRDGRDSRDGHH